jgi:hypothetical protein
MTQSGIFQAPQGGHWQSEQYDLQAYWQQLSYPQLLSPGRVKRGYRLHANRSLFTGLGGAAGVKGIWHRLHGTGH